MEGDAQALPVADGSFDAAISVFGAMFAPDQERTASELLRATRSGGTIGLVSWTPDGFIGQMFKTIGAHVPPPPGVRPPLQWGDDARITELLGEGASGIRNERRTYTFRYPSAQAFVDEFRSYYGPMSKAFEALGDDSDALEHDLVALIERNDRRTDGGPIAVPGTYLETVITRA